MVHDLSHKKSDKGIQKEASGFKKKIKEIYHQKKKRQEVVTDESLSPFATRAILKTEYTPVSKGKFGK